MHQNAVLGTGGRGGDRWIVKRCLEVPLPMGGEEK